MIYWNALRKPMITRSENKDYRQLHFEKTQLINPYTMAQLLLAEPVLNAIRKESKKLSEDIKLDVEEIGKMLRADVLKRDLVESEEAKDATKIVNKAFKKRPQNA